MPEVAERDEVIEEILYNRSIDERADSIVMLAELRNKSVAQIVKDVLNRLGKLNVTTNGAVSESTQ